MVATQITMRLYEGVPIRLRWRVAWPLCRIASTRLFHGPASSSLLEVYCLFVSPPHPRHHSFAAFVSYRPCFGNFERLPRKRRLLFSLPLVRLRAFDRTIDISRPLRKQRRPIHGQTQRPRQNKLCNFKECLRWFAEPGLIHGKVIC